MLEPRLLLSGSLPDLASIATPADDPTLPVAFDDFSPPVDSAVTPDADSPQFAEWTRTVDVLDTLSISGYQLSDYTGNDAGKDTRFHVFGQTTSANDVTADGLIQRLDGDLAAVTLDSSLPTWSAYMIWGENAEGVGRPVMINTTEAW